MSNQPGNQPRLSAHDVARTLRSQLPNAGDVKIHKLLYYCQGWHLAWTGRPMFREQIEAWQNGPVIAGVWHDEDKQRGAPARQELGNTALATVGYVVERYGRLTGRDLIHLTHAETPWRDVSDDPLSTTLIPHELMRDFFSRDDELVRLQTLSDVAAADPEIVRRIDDSIGTAAAEPGVVDDPDEVKRRLAELSS